jgi:hypothetical protein
MASKTMVKQRGQSHKPCFPRSERRQNNKKVLSKTDKSTNLAKVIVEDERIVAALDRLRAGAEIKNEDVADRILCQACFAMLRHWQSKGKSAADVLVTAANALAEMQPSSAMEFMLAAQMIALNDAIFLFMYQATLDETSLVKRDFYTEKVCKLMGVWMQQADCMMRLKGKTGRQKVTVEHVHVHSGGQAIVGEVSAPRTPGEGVSSNV